MAFALFLFVNSCKKELHDDAEKIDAVQRAKIDGYLQGPKVQTISFASFTKNLSIASLGNLKDVMLNAQNVPGSTLKATGQTGNAKPRYKVNTDSVKLLVIDGRSNYIFTIAPVTPRAVTFRNLTISKKGSTVFAFITTYTPTPRWAKNYRLGKKEKFQGRIGYTPVDLNDNDILAIGQLPATIMQGNMAGQKKIQGGAKTNNDNCTSVTVYEWEAYNCASGQHGPGQTCYLTGDGRAGYAMVATIKTECSGGGETTPNPSTDYDPCEAPGNNGQDENAPGENQVPGGEIDETNCGPRVDCANVVNGTAYINPDCNTCMGGTTSITACPPEIINNVVDTCLNNTVEAVLDNDVVGKISEIIANLDKNVNVTVKIYDAEVTSNGRAGQTSATNWSTLNGITHFNTNITLSKDLLLNSTKEKVASVVIHEIIHAYFRQTTAKMEAFEGKYHQDIADEYISPIAGFLSSLFNIDLTDATAIAWDGVADIPAFINADSFKIGSGANAPTISKEALGTIVTNYTLKLNNKGKGICL